MVTREDMDEVNPAILRILNKYARVQWAVYTDRSLIVMRFPNGRGASILMREYDDYGLAVVRWDSLASPLDTFTIDYNNPLTGAAGTMHSQRAWEIDLAVKGISLASPVGDFGSVSG